MSHVLCVDGMHRCAIIHAGGVKLNISAKRGVEHIYYTTVVQNQSFVLQ